MSTDNRHGEPCTCILPHTGQPPKECGHRHDLGRCLEHLAKQQYYEREWERQREERRLGYRF